MSGATVSNRKAAASLGPGASVAVGAPGSPMLQKVTIPVQGMTCAACQSRVQRALQAEPGVVDASVHLMLKQAVITYDSAVTSESSLVEAINRTGYEAKPAVQGQTSFDEQAAQDRAQEEEYLAVRRKALWSGAAGLVAMALSMPLMAANEPGSHGGGGLQVLDHAGGILAVVFACGRLVLRSDGAHGHRDGIDGAAFLCAGLVRAPASRSRYEYAGCGGNRRGLRLFGVGHRLS